jgi:ABC-type Fe3+ transport system permease subunit
MIRFLTSHGSLSDGILVFVLAFANFSIPVFLQLNAFPYEISAYFGAFFNVGQAAVLSFSNIMIAFIPAFWVSQQFSKQKGFEFSPHHCLVSKFCLIGQKFAHVTIISI